MKNATPTASKNKIATAFVNAKLAILDCACLLEMGYPQPPTKFKINNTTTHGTFTKQLMLKQLKAIDVRFYWLRGYSNQK